MIPAVLITRPKDAAAQFAQRLADRLGSEVAIAVSPIMRIRYLSVPLELGDVTDLIFTSAHGVESFARLSERRDFRCWAVGAATAGAAQAQGFAARECGGNADAILAELTAPQSPGVFLHARGEHATGDLVTRLSARGVTARDTVVYDQPSQALSAMARDLLAGAAPVILPLFSARSARLLSQGGPFRAPLWGVALSENVAKAAESLNCRQMTVVMEHNSRAMVDAIADLVRPPDRLEHDLPPQ